MTFVKGFWQDFKASFGKMVSADFAGNGGFPIFARCKSKSSCCPLFAKHHRITKKRRGLKVVVLEMFKSYDAISSISSKYTY